jgi:predicted Zn-dependent peptidase
MDPKMYSFKLKNGMKVILIPRNTKNLVYFSIVMKNGKIDETLNTLSYTHAFEHLLAQFTS